MARSIHTANEQKKKRKNTYRTPEYVLDLARHIGPIAFDPATGLDNPTHAQVFATRRGVFKVTGSRISPKTGLTCDWGEMFMLGASRCAPDVGSSGNVVGSAGKATEPWFSGTPIAFGQSSAGSSEPSLSLSRGTVPFVWSNFPYGGEIQPFTQKLVTTKPIVAHEIPMISLVAVRSETDWWRAMWRTAKYCLFWGSPTLGSRIRFTLPQQRKTKKVAGLGIPSNLFFWGDGEAADRFYESFSPHGLILRCKDGQLPPSRVTVPPRRSIHARTVPPVQSGSTALVAP